jgi:hypothetical protein
MPDGGWGRDGQRDEHEEGGRRRINRELMTRSSRQRLNVNVNRNKINIPASNEVGTAFRATRSERKRINAFGGRGIWPAENFRVCAGGWSSFLVGNSSV